MAVLDYQPQIWREALDLPKGDEPAAPIAEGIWWLKTATENSFAHLSDIREFDFPDLIMSERKGRSIAYCCAYVAALTVEPACTGTRCALKMLHDSNDRTINLCQEALALSEQVQQDI